MGDVEKMNDESNSKAGMTYRINHLVRCYSGDYLHDCEEDTFSFSEAAANGLGSDGGLYSYIARFVPVENTHKITFKVADDSKDYGSIVGSNGNSFNENSNTMQEFSFNEADVNGTMFFNTGNPNINGSSAYFLSRAIGLKNNAQEYPEFN